MPNDMSKRFADTMAQAIFTFCTVASSELTMDELNSEEITSWVDLLNRLPKEEADQAIQDLVDSVDEYDAYYNSDDVCPGLGIG